MPKIYVLKEKSNREEISEIEKQQTNKKTYKTESLSLKLVMNFMCSQLLRYCWLCNPMDIRMLGSSVHEIFQAKILEWLPKIYLN